VRVDDPTSVSNHSMLMHRDSGRMMIWICPSPAPVVRPAGPTCMSGAVLSELSM